MGRTACAFVRVSCSFARFWCSPSSLLPLLDTPFRPLHCPHQILPFVHTPLSSLCVELSGALCRAPLPPGADQLYDRVIKLWIKIDTKAERGELTWMALVRSPNPACLWRTHAPVRSPNPACPWCTHARTCGTSEVAHTCTLHARKTGTNQKIGIRHSSTTFDFCGSSLRSSFPSGRKRSKT